MTRASICAPLAAEWLALRPVHAPLLRTGMGPRRSIGAAQRLRGQGVLVAGVAGGLAAHVRAGDVVVATEVQGPDSQRVACPSAPLLAGELRRLGLTVHTGPI